MLRGAEEKSFFVITSGDAGIRQRQFIATEIYGG